MFDLGVIPFENHSIIKAIKEVYSAKDCLVKHGAKLSGNNTFKCVLHNDEHNSAEYYPADDRWRCYAGCTEGKGFDVIDTEAALRCVSNQEAIRLLAQELGLNEQAKQGPKRFIREHFYQTAEGQAVIKKRIFEQGGRKTAEYHYLVGDRWIMGGSKELNRMIEAKEFAKPATPLYQLPELLKGLAAGKKVLYVVEGEKDVHTLAGIGLLATTTGGAGDYWKPAQIQIIPKEVKVIILRDNDEAGRKYGDNTASKFKEHGCEVKVIDLPDLPAKGDVSDWLGAGRRKEDLLSVVEGWPEWKGVDREESNSDLPAAFRDVLHREGFDIRSGAFVAVRKTQEGDEVRRLCNFIAWPIAEEVLDDGDDSRRQYRIKGKLSNGHNLPEIKVTAEDFEGLKWVSQQWGLKTIVKSGQGYKDRIREAIQHLAANLEQKTIYVHTGWRNIGGKWVYLHAGGAIGSDAVTVDLSGAGTVLQNYDLTDRKSGHDAGAAFKEFMKVAVPRVIFPLIGAVALAPCWEMVRKSVKIDFALFLVGRTGSGKSSLAALALNFFGDFDTSSFPANFRQTANSFEKTAFTVKDALLVVDDYFPAQTRKERDALKSMAQSLCRGYGDGAARVRMRSDMTIRAGYRPRGLAVCTGEERAEIGESGSARFVYLDIGRDDVRYEDVYLPLWGKREALRGWMREYLAWIAESWDELEKSLPEQYQQVSDYIGNMIDGGRVQTSAAKLLIGVWLSLQFMQVRGWMTEEEAKQAADEAKAGIMAAARANMDELAEEKPTKQFLSALAELIASGTIRITDIDAGETEEVFGAIGEREGGVLYILPLKAYEAVSTMFKNQGRAFSLEHRTIWKRLLEAGHLIQGKERPTTVKRRMRCMGKKTVWVAGIKEADL